MENRELSGHRPSHLSDFFTQTCETHDILQQYQPPMSWHDSCSTHIRKRGGGFAGHAAPRAFQPMVRGRIGNR
jgi:hypothetical protein